MICRTKEKLNKQINKSKRVNKIKQDLVHIGDHSVTEIFPNHICDKVFKNGPSGSDGPYPFKFFEGFHILEYFSPNTSDFKL